MPKRVRGRHRAPSPSRRTAALAVTAGAAVVLPVLAPSVASAAELAPSVDWAPIIACESGGDPTAQNPTSSASGYFQIVDGTWKANGGTTAHAYQASVAEQTAVANRIYAVSGLVPWSASKSCWAGKMTSTKTAPKAPRVVEKTAAPKAKTSSHAPAKTQTKPSWADSARSGVYTVHKGDTLSGIAASHGKPSWRDVYQRNRGVIGNDANLILPGQQLTL